tara:strand:+ start:1649 stop:2356 length:708 start_codon:yes stop_codon:yes gene_type:complete
LRLILIIIILSSIKGFSQNGLLGFCVGAGYPMSAKNDATYFLHGDFGFNYHYLKNENYGIGFQLNIIDRQIGVNRFEEQVEKSDQSLFEATKTASVSAFNILAIGPSLFKTKKFKYFKGFIQLNTGITLNKKRGLTYYYYPINPTTYNYKIVDFGGYNFSLGNLTGMSIGTSFSGWEFSNINICYNLSYFYGKFNIEYIESTDQSPTLERVKFSQSIGTIIHSIKLSFMFDPKLN